MLTTCLMDYTLVQDPTHKRGYTLQGAHMSLANADSRYREDLPLHSHLM
jgi:hypothetical protein